MTDGQTIVVWDKRHTISVYQKSKKVWGAVGEYMGERLEGKGSSRASAVKHWAEAARSRGN